MSQARNGGATTAGDEDIDWRIVSAVADAKGVEPLELDERLYDVVDPDAIYNLFAGHSGGASAIRGEVSFTLDRCQVTVYDDLTVDVRPLDDVAAD
jgi:hypothetical protein